MGSWGMGSGLSRRNQRTLAAVARILIPPGGAIPWGADDVDLAHRIDAEVAAWPPRVRRMIGLLLAAFEYLPLTVGRRPFSRLAPEAQRRFVERAYHHRSALRRLAVTLLKQLAYAIYLSVPEVESAVGYHYRCARPRAGVVAEEQVHH